MLSRAPTEAWERTERLPSTGLNLCSMGYLEAFRASSPNIGSATYVSSSVHDGLPHSAWTRRAESLGFVSPSLGEATTKVDVAVSVSSASKGDAAVLDVRNIDTGSIGDYVGCEVGLRAGSAAVSAACASPRQTAACGWFQSQSDFRGVPCSPFLSAPRPKGPRTSGALRGGIHL